MDKNLIGVLVIFGAYLLGSIPWSLIIGKVFYKTDIRKHGSGNLGGTNAGRTLGKKAGISVTILDGLKAFFTVFICVTWFPEWTIFAGLACCVGHCFPIFANFKGGKAIATTMGYLLGLGIFVTHNLLGTFFLPVFVFFITLYLTKMVSFSSLVAVGTEAIASFFITSDLRISISIVILFIFVTYRHKDNIKRIINGTERKVTWI